jgi:hypothetical protein
MTAALAIALAVAFAAITALIVNARILKGMLREHARERQLLLNQLLNLAGKPWLPAPAEMEPEPEPEPSGEPLLMVAPDQLPDY